MPPINPKKRVIIIWLKLPTAVEKTAFILFSFFKTNIRPANSPVLLGVKIAKAIPDNTAFIALIAFKDSNFLIKYLHFTDSMYQFKGISKTTITKRTGSIELSN